MDELTQLRGQITEGQRAEAALRWHVELVRLISSLSTRFINLDLRLLDSAVEEALANLGRFTGADRSYVFLFDDARATMSNTHEWCADGIAPQKDELQDIPWAQMPWWMNRLRRFETIHIPAVADLPSEAAAEKGILEAQAIRSLIVVPMRCAEELLGFLGFDDCGEERLWTDDDIAVLRLVGEMFANVLDRKRGEEKMRQFKAVIGASHEAIAISDPGGRILDANPAHERLFGPSLGRNWREFCAPESVKRLDASAVPALARGESWQGELEAIDVNGRRFPLWERADCLRDVEGNVLCTFAIMHDVSEQRRRDEALRASEARHRTLVELVPDIIYCLDPDGRILFISPGVSALGYRPEDLIGRRFEEIVDPDDAAKVGSFVERRVGERVRRELEIRLLNQSGERRDHAAREVVVSARGLWNVADCRIQEAGKTFLGTLGIARDITARKRNEEELSRYRDELEELVQERTRALEAANVELKRENIERRKIEQDLKASLDRLHQAAEGVVQAMAKMTEIRDPYTAGHQQRVADLACAIGRKVGLNDDSLAGLRVAGLVHDVGKVSVPAEILSKPGRLAEAEFALIRAHPEAGYNILCGIDFPWPVVDIVRQHHERVDGSGYPHGLCGDEICVEARILAVADVVEAMASHRPYRLALGIDKALAEIRLNRGVLYDPAAADACIELFSDDGYRLATPDDAASGKGSS